MLTTSVFMSLFFAVLALEDTCKYEFTVPADAGCVVHTKEMEMSYERMKTDITSGNERTTAMAETFTKEIGILHQKMQEHQQHLDRLVKETSDDSDTLKSLPQITQELADVSKTLAENKQKSIKIYKDHENFKDSMSIMRKDIVIQAKNITEINSDLAEHRLALMSYGVTLDKIKGTEENMGDFQKQLNMIKQEFQSTRNVISDLNEKVFAIEASIKSTTAAMSSLSRLPGLVRRLQAQIQRLQSSRR